MSKFNHIIYKRTYSAWSEMRRRCLDPRRQNYERYGGKGISYTPSWDSFDNFLKDTGECPEGYSLDRINNSLSYTPENCRWATTLQQAANKGDYKNNTSGCKGVAFHIRLNKWIAYVNRNGKRTQLYSGDFYEDAVKARKEWEAANG